MIREQCIFYRRHFDRSSRLQLEHNGSASNSDRFGHGEPAHSLIFKHRGKQSQKVQGFCEIEGRSWSKGAFFGIQQYLRSSTAIMYGKVVLRSVGKIWWAIDSVSVRGRKKGDFRRSGLV